MLRVYDGRSFSHRPRQGLLVVEKQKPGHDAPVRFTAPDEVPPFLRELLPLPSFVYRGRPRRIDSPVTRHDNRKRSPQKPSPADPRAART